METMAKDHQVAVADAAYSIGVNHIRTRTEEKRQRPDEHPHEDRRATRSCKRKTVMQNRGDEDEGK